MERRFCLLGGTKREIVAGIVSLSDEDVQRLISFPELVDVMRRTFIAAANGKVVCPPRTALNVPDGWFATMPASLALDGLQGLGAKLITAFPANGTRNLPTHLATVALFDPTTGIPIASIAANWLTDARTAAVSVVATAALASATSVHAILGSGAQARAHLRGFAELQMISKARIWARTASGAAAIAELATLLGLDATVHDSADEAVRGADVITTVTASPTPLFAADAVKPGAHVNAVGACVPTKRELPAELLARSLVVVDSRAAALLESGDILLAIKDGAIEADSIAGELADVLAGRIQPRTSAAAITIFESLGLAMEDIAAAALVYARAQR